MFHDTSRYFNFHSRHLLVDSASGWITHGNVQVNTFFTKEVLQGRVEKVFTGLLFIFVHGFPVNWFTFTGRNVKGFHLVLRT